MWVLFRWEGGVMVPGEGGGVQYLGWLGHGRAAGLSQRLGATPGLGAWALGTGHHLPSASPSPPGP